jgi:hypothetical protein
VKALKNKRESINNWYIYAREYSSSSAIEQTVKGILSVKSKDIVLDFALRSCYVKSIKKFFKYPIITGSFDCRGFKVKIKVYNPLSKQYKMEYEIAMSSGSLIKGQGSVDTCFSIIKETIKKL